ncbi:MAG: hypothetical protein ACRET4_03790 [Steroidobacteraceae bacterium]
MKASRVTNAGDSVRDSTRAR